MRLRTILPAVLAVLTLAGITACGDVGQPVDLARVNEAQRPLPQNAGEPEPVDDEPAPDCGDPTASLRPNSDISAGSTMAKIRERGYLIAGIDQNTYLFGFRNPNTGQMEGFDIDVTRAIANALLGDPNKVQFRALTSAQRVPALQDGDVDIVARTMTMTCGRWQDINFSSEYYTAGQRLLVNANSRAESLEDLRGRNVCSAKGSTSIDRIAEAGGKPLQVDNWSDCLVVLQQGQVAGVTTDDSILAGMAAQDPNTKIVGPRFSTEPYGIGIPKENEDMVRYVNSVLDDFRGGEWARSYGRWLSELGAPPRPPAPKYQD
ncbi:amino acid ABC transporter substrate-binding protein (PAAT family) [Tamaricihabitans halophyticus]|uniref:Amino acid ABC transporter substrate-binding protein (PAAT family) n=2 Tax=Tamaricihabitans halophyticus TaxID=1262583 RepID=A0A4R2Q221_9PSEU|nr:amino acid ABC transporter substrate-binding protein (PAAT family) [Tamaricihabitans halophyticus]